MNEPIVTYRNTGFAIGNAASKWEISISWNDRNGKWDLGAKDQFGAIAYIPLTTQEINELGKECINYAERSAAVGR